MAAPALAGLTPKFARATMSRVGIPRDTYQQPQHDPQNDDRVLRGLP